MKAKSDVQKLEGLKSAWSGDFLDFSVAYVVWSPAGGFSSPSGGWREGAQRHQHTRRGRSVTLCDAGVHTTILITRESRFGWSTRFTGAGHRKGSSRRAQEKE